MRLSWLLLLFAVITVSFAQKSDSTDSTTTDSVETTTAASGGNDDGTTTGATDNGDTEEPHTDGPKPTTEEPPPEETEDPNFTGSTTLKTTKKAEVTTTVKTTKKAVSTTTKEPRPDVEDWNVKCDAVTKLCTYSMQVPGLDIDTYNTLICETNQTETDVLNFQDVDLVNLQQGVTKVFDDADATADYVKDQLDLITQEIKDLYDQVTDLKNAFTDLDIACQNADANLQKILAKKGSCLYRQCILKETTTPRPITTTTVRTTPTPFCERSENKDKLCQNGGSCVTWYDSYYCTCPGNLDGQDLSCVTSVCDVFKSPQVPGPIYSPGYNGTDYSGPADDAEDCDDGAQWTVKAIDSTNKVLTLAETEAQWGKNGDDFISELSSDSNLQITVGKYKLKVTKKTKYQQIVQVLNYGPTATISYSGPKEDYFHFTLTEIPPPTPASGS